VLLLTLGSVAHAGAASPADAPEPPRFDEDLHQGGFAGCDPVITGRAGDPPTLWECAVFVGRVLAVNDREATHAAPPTVLLEVEEVLGGDVTSGGRLLAVWAEHLHIPCPVGEWKRIAAWNDTPQRGPAVGARYLVAGKPSRSHRWFLTVPELREPFTPRARERLQRAVRQERQRLTRRERAWVDSLRADIRASVSDDALLAAVRARDAAQVRALLRSGARAVARSGDGTPALHEAARLGAVDVLAGLLEARAPADLESYRHDRVTALVHAVWGGHADAVALLLKHGADPQRRTSGGDSLLRHARRQGHTRIVQLLGKSRRTRQ
jgi:hypothetical protein